MPFYYNLSRDFSTLSDRKYVVEKILKLKEQIRKDVPVKQSEEALLIATWNIRDLGKTNRRGFGSRTKDSHYYIAEIISAFDVLAIQEVNELQEWDIIMKILGPSWDYIATDVTHSKLGGNGERLTYVYDTRKVWFKNIAGEIVLPNNMLISKSELVESGDKLFDKKQFRRTPFIVSFQSSWFKFDICTVHIYYGEGKDGLAQRVQEIKRIGEYLSKRADQVLKEEDKATILLGDFNIIRPDHETMKALEAHGFMIPDNIRSAKSNVIETMYYDQIAFKSDTALIDFVDTPNNSGVFKIMESVFTDSEEDFEFYEKAVVKSSKGKKLEAERAKLKNYYVKEWRTYQMSDHNLLWVRIPVDKSEKYLRKLAGEE